MKFGLILALGLCLTFNANADETIDDMADSSTPPADLVIELHEFCKDMHSEDGDSAILACINEQLDIAAYSSISSLPKR